MSSGFTGIRLAGPEEIERAISLLAGVQDGFYKAFTAASRSAETAMIKAAEKAVLEKTTLNKTDYERHVKHYVKRSPEMTEAVFTGRKIPVSEFLHAQRSEGVAVEIYKGEGMKVMTHTFTATMPNGYYGILERLGRPSKRNPKREAIGSKYNNSIPHFLNKGDVSEKIEDAAASKFSATLDKQIDKLLNQFGGSGT